MARDDETGELPSTQTEEWRDVRQALRQAQAMAMATARGLRTLQQPAIRRHVLRPADPRLATRPSTRQSRVQGLLATHFRLRDPGPFDILNLADGYQRIHERLMGLERRSFRMVTARVANSVAEGGHGDTFGYVRPEQPNTIFLNDAYFSRGGPAATATETTSPGDLISRTRLSVVEAGGENVHVQQSLLVRASIVLHETVHLAVGADGAVHRAIRAGTRIRVGFEDCRTSYSQITTLNQAIGDAYVWEKFARCVFSIQSSTGPEGRQRRRGG